MILDQLRALTRDYGKPVRAHIALPGGGYVYIRLSQRLLVRTVEPTVEVVDINVGAQQWRGTGRQVFRDCEQHARETGAAVFAENVHTQALVAALERWGYQRRAPNFWGSPSDYWKWP